MKYRILTFFFVLAIFFSSVESFGAREIGSEFLEFLPQWIELQEQIPSIQSLRVGIDGYQGNDQQNEIDIYYQRYTGDILIEVSQQIPGNMPFKLRFITNDNLEDVYINLPDVMLGMNQDNAEIIQALTPYEGFYTQIESLDFRRTHFQNDFIDALRWVPRADVLTQVENGIITHFDKGWTLQQKGDEIPLLLYDLMGNFYWNYKLELEGEMTDGQVDITIDQSVRHEQNRRNIEVITKLSQQLPQQDQLELRTNLNIKNLIRRPIEHVLYMHTQTKQYRVGISSLVDFVDTSLDSEKGASLENKEARLVYELQPYEGTKLSVENISLISLNEIEELIEDVMNNNGDD